MLAKDSATIAYSAEPQVLTVSVLKDGAIKILQELANLNIISMKKQDAAKSSSFMDFYGIFKDNPIPDKSELRREFHEKNSLPRTIRFSRYYE
jgi:hypothetical protein